MGDRGKEVKVGRTGSGSGAGGRGDSGEYSAGGAV